MKIIEMARQMGKEIQASDEYKALYNAKEANDNDSQLQELIEKFNLKRVELNVAMSSEEKDEEKISKCNTELQDLYNSVMSNENMVAFNKANSDLNDMMNQITTILMKSVNGEDPETCAAVEEHSCGGSCSSCSGCH